MTIFHSQLTIQNRHKTHGDQLASHAAIWNLKPLAVFETTPAEIVTKGKGRDQQLTVARQMAIYSCQQMGD